MINALNIFASSPFIESVCYSKYDGKQEFVVSFKPSSQRDEEPIRQEYLARMRDLVDRGEIQTFDLRSYGFTAVIRKPKNDRGTAVLPESNLNPDDLITSLIETLYHHPGVENMLYERCGEDIFIDVQGERFNRRRASVATAPYHEAVSDLCNSLEKAGMLQTLNPEHDGLEITLRQQPNIPHPQVKEIISAKDPLDNDLEKIDLIQSTKPLSIQDPIPKKEDDYHSRSSNLTYVLDPVTSKRVGSKRGSLSKFIEEYQLGSDQFQQLIDMKIKYGTSLPTFRRLINHGYHLDEIEVLLDTCENVSNRRSNPWTSRRLPVNFHKFRLETLVKIQKRFDLDLEPGYLTGIVEQIHDLVRSRCASNSVKEAIASSRPGDSIKCVIERLEDAAFLKSAKSLMRDVAHGS